MTPNQSHGHVTPNANGLVARCGGPAICAHCQFELAQLRAKSTPAEVAQGGDLFVVGYHCRDEKGLATLNWLPHENAVPLMTVAQHNRIMSDVRASRDAVLKVMQARKLLPKCAPSIEAEILDNYARMFEEEAERNAELVELLRNKFPRIDPCQPVPLDEKAHCCEYTIYVERERLHRLIDAKLASL